MTFWYLFGTIVWTLLEHCAKDSAFVAYEIHESNRIASLLNGNVLMYDSCTQQLRCSPSLLDGLLPCPRDESRMQLALLPSNLPIGYPAPRPASRPASPVPCSVGQ